ncbi:disease resistance protein RPV1-like isoform X1 [Lotus japonicus]|uniref:disease resistance protein RPV1-like isoform X1 n=1 Tax=Lotus japonicus TaxID=34305 RepID=UPI00258D5198|nr:disease resistance protein RPV1-like isoform X1 [Lotus japonicus]XP_057437146.1 disease resistance protein RPV1-like isoform X1 [Lotus japonicus]
MNLPPTFLESLPDCLQILCWEGFPLRSLLLSSRRKNLPDCLQILCWEGFPLRSLLLSSRRKNLVKLYMRNSHLEQLSEDDLELPNLKRLDLSFSSNLIQIPDLFKFPNIEEIILDCCRSLIQVHSSGFLNELKLLWLNSCVELTSLNIRSNILSRSFGLVGLYNCWRLNEFSICGTRAVGEFSGAKEIYDDARCLDVEYSNDLGKLRGITPSGFIHELCWLDLSDCSYLKSLPADVCKLILLRRLYLDCCLDLVNFPEIEEPMENLAVLSLVRTSIQKLPSSLHRLVGLEELNLFNCHRLKMIPSSIGTLTKLCKLDLRYCESLKTFPSSIFKLKLTGLDLTGCSKLKTFPEILEPAESFTHIGLIGTKIKELPSSLDRLVGLQTLRIASHDLESLPNTIGNLNLLSCLYIESCDKLTEIPNDIVRLSSSLTKLSLRNIGIVSLPESIAHLSRLESLDVSRCKKLECIPALPPSMKKLLAFNCPSITRVVPNPSDSKEGTFIFNLTSSGEHNPSAHCNIVEDARRRIIEGAYRSVYYCFPGSAVPHWFPYHCEGNSLTLDKDSLNMWHDNRVSGLAVCVVLQNPFCDYLRFSLTYESDGRTHELRCDDDQLEKSLNKSLFQMEDDMGFHTFLWKYDLMDSANIDKGTFHALKFTFETSTLTWLNIATVKRCGICPLYTKEKKRKLNDGLVD